MKKRGIRDAMIGTVAYVTIMSLSILLQMVFPGVASRLRGKT